MRRVRRVAGWWALACCGLVSIAGCIVAPPIDDGGNGGGNGDPNNGGGSVATITIRIVNLTETTLDPDLYISATAVSRDELFVPARKYTAYGVGTLGLIGGFDSDSFTIPCSEARIIATAGGRFGDNLNIPDGTGREIILTQDLSVFCGSRVTFTYSRDGSGYTTSFLVD